MAVIKAAQERHKYKTKNSTITPPPHRKKNGYINKTRSSNNSDNKGTAIEMSQAHEDKNRKP